MVGKRTLSLKTTNSKTGIENNKRERIGHHIHEFGQDVRLIALLTIPFRVSSI